MMQTVDCTNQHVAYTSESQLNWAAFTKEAYAIYMSVKKLNFYLGSAQIPLKKFLEKNTMNSKINNFAVELKFIAGTKNVLADTLSMLIELDENIKLPEERARI